MATQITIREFHFPSDYEETLQLWESMDAGVRVGRSDTPEEIEKKLERDPDLFLVAEWNEHIVGTVIGGFDGRRGMIYHLAVHNDLRRQGLASQLLSEVEARMQAKGCLKSYLLVFGDNTDAIRFYEGCGWREMTDDRIFGKEFP